MKKPYVITIFGAESTGKTTLSRQLAADLDAEWVPEFARPYLETTSPRISEASMRAIWRGQRALQHESRRSPRVFVVQDTDLFSTVGYWQFSHVSASVGPCPEALISDALALQSDLYLILQSNIPFEADPLRYGGDKRESTDAYWIDLCDRYELPCRVINLADPAERIKEVIAAINQRSPLCVA